MASHLQKFRRNSSKFAREAEFLPSSNSSTFSSHEKYNSGNKCPIDRFEWLYKTFPFHRFNGIRAINVVAMPNANAAHSEHAFSESEAV